jgi:hypothetical protein
MHLKNDGWNTLEPGSQCLFSHLSSWQLAKEKHGRYGDLKGGVQGPEQSQGIKQKEDPSKNISHFPNSLYEPSLAAKSMAGMA